MLRLGLLRHGPADQLQRNLRAGLPGLHAGESHRAGQNRATWPSALTGNPYQPPRTWPAARGKPGAMCVAQTHRACSDMMESVVGDLEDKCGDPDADVPVRGGAAS